MIYALNYGNSEYVKPQKLQTKTAYKNGVDKVIEFSPDDIDCDFREKNYKILNQKRGNGYWLWKPYFINKVLNMVKEDDWVIYLDAAIYYRKNVKKYIQKLEKRNIDFVIKENKFIEKAYTKRDIFVELACDDKKFTDTNQRTAGAIIIKNNKKNRQIIDEWLRFGQINELITDAPNKCGMPNYKEFVENRHDQSIFSVITKKYNDGIYIDNLYTDIVVPKKGDVLFTYHHTNCGNKLSAYFFSIIRVLKLVFNSISGK